MPAAADGPVMLGARIVGDDSRVRFVADLSQKVTATVFTLADPDRIVVDLPRSALRPAELAGASGRGLISAFRYGLISPGKSRIVMDLNGPALIDKTFVVDPADGQPARLVIDAVPTDPRQFPGRHPRLQGAAARQRRAMRRTRIPRPRPATTATSR